MKDRFILTPYFLDQHSPELESLAEEKWFMNSPMLLDGDVLERMSGLYEDLANITANSISQGLRPVSIAGDCCATIGVMAGLQRSGLEPLLLWFDAHGDFNTWETTPSGFLGGMPLAMLVGRGEQQLLDSLRMSPIGEQNVILIGARDLDPGEKLAIETSKVLYLRNPSELFDHRLPNQDLYVHFDVDILDPVEAPAVGFPAQRGISSNELINIFISLKNQYRVAAASLSSWDPDLDKDGHSRAVCLRTFQSLLE